MNKLQKLWFISLVLSFSHAPIFGAIYLPLETILAFDQDPDYKVTERIKNSLHQTAQFLGYNAENNEFDIYYENPKKNTQYSVSLDDFKHTIKILDSLWTSRRFEIQTFLSLCANTIPEEPILNYNCLAHFKMLERLGLLQIKELTLTNNTKTKYQTINLAAHCITLALIKQNTQEDVQIYMPISSDE